ncbi:MAG: DNA/RNA non-specific endonuclease [Bacteroidota bacterium]
MVLPSAEIVFYGLTPERYGIKVRVDRLTNIGPPGTSPKVTSPAWELLKRRKYGKGTYYVRGHLLNDNLHGPGNNWKNLTPLTQEANNTGADSMEKKFEKPIKDVVTKGQNAVFFEVRPVYGSRTNALEAKLVQKEQAGSISADDQIRLNIIREEAKIPISMDCYAREYPMNHAPMPKTRSAASALPVPPSVDLPGGKLEEDIENKVDDSKTYDLLPKDLNPAMIDDPNGMRERLGNNGVDDITISAILKAVVTYQFMKRKTIKQIRQLKEEIGKNGDGVGIQENVQEYFDKGIIKMQGNVSFIEQWENFPEYRSMLESTGRRDILNKLREIDHEFNQDLD